MENFVVSARKYRPATFGTVVGQKAITNTLKNAIKSHHLAQAFLFCGPRGVGKTTCARILAKTINCTNISPQIEACDECESCKSFNSGHSLNVYELDAASNNSVDDIRSLVEQVRFAPQLGSHKIYIIDEVHMLSQAAFNAFLKTLEEPPKHAIFILATTERHKIIPTILSRCQIFDFSRIQIEDIAEHLSFIAQRENIATETDALHIIAQKADGALRDALSIFDQIVSSSGSNLTYKAVIDNLNILDYDYYFKVADAVLEENIPSALLLFNEILNNGFDGHNFISGLGEHLRNLMVCKDQSTIQLLEVGNNIKDKYKEQSSKCTIPLLLRGLNIVSKCDIQYKASKNQRLQVELSLMQLCSMNLVSGQEKKNDIIKQEIKPVTVPSAPIPTPVPAVQTPAKPVTQELPKIAEKQVIVESPVKPMLEEPPVKAQSTTPEQVSSSPKKIIITSSPSISQFLGTSVSTDKNKSTDLNEPRQEYQQPTAIFTAEMLEDAWSRYAKTIQIKMPFLYATLTTRKHVLKENYCIELTVENETASERINEEKSELLEFLRKELNNFKIALNAVVSKDEKELKPYTPQDKFKRMAEKNPALNKLRQQFDLEVDF